jgi:hypothetical protein
LDVRGIGLQGIGDLSVLVGTRRRFGAIRHRRNVGLGRIVRRGCARVGKTARIGGTAVAVVAQQAGWVDALHRGTGGQTARENRGGGKTQRRLGEFCRHRNSPTPPKSLIGL